MTPIQLSSALRHIATKIDNSKNPSRAAVSAELRRVISRIAGRVDVVNTVDHAFNAEGIYPPVMKQTGPNTYEGEIDTGWNLKVVEKSPGVMDVYLNGAELAGLDEVIYDYKSKTISSSVVINKELLNELENLFDNFNPIGRINHVLSAAILDDLKTQGLRVISTDDGTNIAISVSYINPPAIYEEIAYMAEHSQFDPEAAAHSVATELQPIIDQDNLKFGVS